MAINSDETWLKQIAGGTSPNSKNHWLQVLASGTSVRSDNYWLSQLASSTGSDNSLLRTIVTNLEAGTPPSGYPALSTLGVMSDNYWYQRWAASV